MPTTPNGRPAVEIIDKGSAYCPEWLHFDCVESPLGDILVASSIDGVCFMGFSTGKRDDDISALRVEFPHSQLLPIAEKIHSDAVSEAFGDSEICPPVRLVVWGTDFRKKVWLALMEIPRGTTITYGTLAEKIGCRYSARAVGTALGHNRVAPLLPCHRVVPAIGHPGQYRWGSCLKERLLAFEKTYPKGVLLSAKR